jgi:hypothetical protein
VDAEKRRVDGLERGRAMRARFRHCLHAEEVDDKEAMIVCFVPSCFVWLTATFRCTRLTASLTHGPSSDFQCLGASLQVAPAIDFLYTNMHFVQLYHTTAPSYL